MAAVYSDLEGQVLLAMGGRSDIGESIAATPVTAATITGLITPVLVLAIPNKKAA